jgi:choline dehydrogenase-like flavoprotein
VIEAGQDGRAEPGIYTPGKKGSTFGTKYDWNLTTIPQTNLVGRVIRMTRGHVLGGSSALNLMTWDRASIADYDAWEALGNKGWNFKNMYRSMLKVENFFPSPEYGKNGVGKGGPVQTLINRILPAHQLAFPPTMIKLGLPANYESLDGNPIGVSRQPSNIREKDYTRSYSPAYLDLANDNLFLKLSTRVSKVNFKGKTASGVTLDDGTVITATKEVILAAGTLQSPQLLELSGIGDTAILTAAGIKTIYHLPGVGEHLQDHIRVQNSYQLKDGALSFDRLRYNTTFAAEQQALYDAKAPSEYDYTGSGYAYMPWSTVSYTAAASLLALAKAAVTAASPTSVKYQLGYLTNKKLSASVPQLELIFSDGYTGVCNLSPLGRR